MLTFLADTARKALEKKRVWSMAVYVEESPLSTDTRLRRPLKVFNSKRLRFSRSYPHTQADPFMITWNGSLYVFCEIVTPGRLGKIGAYRTRDLNTFDYLGIVLDEPYHLSFPFVFRDAHADVIYLLPESAQANQLSLYQFDQFPYRLRKVGVLLSGKFYDSFLVNREGTWFLFTTSERGLEIYFSESLLGAPFASHPVNPVSRDPRTSRSGGGPLYMNGNLYRVAQDCAGSYGRNVSLIRIVELSKTAYKEEIARSDFFELNETWNADGSHHLVVESLNGKHVIMVDGKQLDYFANRVFSTWHATIRPLCRYEYRT